MHRTRLMTVALVAFVACKKESSEAQKTATTEQKVTAPATMIPDGHIYAASTHLRVIDAAQGRVSASLDLGKAINAIAVSRDGADLFLATSAGVYRVDARTHQGLERLTTSPARNVVLGSAGDVLHALEHDVIVAADGTRDIRPYRLRTIDVATRKTTREEEIGQRVLFAFPSEGGRQSLVISEDGRVFIGDPRAKLSSGRPLALTNDAELSLRIREGAMIAGDVAYVPVEGPTASVLEIDLVRGEGTRIPLPHAGPLRGLSLTKDDKTLLVNGANVIFAVDRASRSVRGRLPLETTHQGLALAPNGQFAYLLQTIDGTGGAVGLVALEPLAYRGKVHLDDISPWTIAVSPR